MLCRLGQDIYGDVVWIRGYALVGYDILAMPGVFSQENHAGGRGILLQECRAKGVWLAVLFQRAAR